MLGRTAIGYFKSDRENSIWESRGDPQQLPTHFLSPKTKSPKITSEQICSFVDGDTHTRSIDLVGVESAHSAIPVKDSQMKPETPNVSRVTPHFWREMQMKP